MGTTFGFGLLLGKLVEGRRHLQGEDIHKAPDLLEKGIITIKTEKKVFIEGVENFGSLGGDYL